jgi:hypothetical protein
MAILCMIASEDHPPPIRRSAASGGVMTAIQSTPSSQPYDSGGSFRRRARQGFKKAARSKEELSTGRLGTRPCHFFIYNWYPKLLKS